MLVMICVLKTTVITLVIVVHVFLMLVVNSCGHLPDDILDDLRAPFLACHRDTSWRSPFPLFHCSPNRAILPVVR